MYHFNSYIVVEHLKRFDSRWQLTVVFYSIESRCNLLVSLARVLFLNWLYMNEVDYFEIN